MEWKGREGKGGNGMESSWIEHNRMEKHNFSMVKKYFKDLKNLILKT
jgi:hypothetical protein